MIEFVIDGEARQAPDSLESWGKLLDFVETAAGRAGRAVTAVRCNGVVQPSFRAPGTASRPVAIMGRIEFETSDARALLQETIAMARNSLGVLASSARRTAGRFQAGDAQGAGADLARLVDAIRALTVLTGAVADVIDLRRAGKGAVQSAGGSEVTAAVGAALRELAECQTQEDWTRTAWCLEQHLAPAVLRWQALFDRFNQLREAA